MSDKKVLLEKHLQVKEFGDSLYVPLTRFFKPIDVGKDQVVHVVLYSDGIIVISNPNKK